MLYIIIIFLLYSIKIVNSESYHKYSGYSGNSNFFYSNVFNSGYSGNSNFFYSNAFNSGKNHYSLYSRNIDYSIVFNSKIFSYSKSTHQNYLTFYNSYDLQSRKSYNSFDIKSSKESNSVWGYLSLIKSHTLPISKTYSNVISFSTPPFLNLATQSIRSPV